MKRRLARVALTAACVAACGVDEPRADAGAHDSALDDAVAYDAVDTVESDADALDAVDTPDSADLNDLSETGGTDAEPADAVATDADAGSGDATTSNADADAEPDVDTTVDVASDSDLDAGIDADTPDADTPGPDATDADTPDADAIDPDVSPPTPCAADDECGPARVCGLASVCIDARPALTASFAAVSTAELFAWPFADDARGVGARIGDRAPGALLPLPDGRTAWAVGDAEGGADWLCAFAWSGTAFEPVAALCDGSLTEVSALAWRPSDPSPIRTASVAELWVATPGHLYRVAADGLGERRDAFEVLPAGDPRRACKARLVSMIDFDLDGWLDVYVECELPDSGSAFGAMVFAADGRDGFALDSIELEPELTRYSRRLAHGVVDLDDDGLLDLVLVNDSFSNPTVRLVSAAPGYVAHRCSPLEACAYRATRLATNSAAWGSFMGAAMLNVDSLGQLLLVTDRGPIRALDPLTLSDHAQALGIALGGSAPDWLFSWSTVVEDFDRNGLDDLFVTHGSPISTELEAGEAAPHPNVLMLQSGGGRFGVLSDPGWQGTDPLETSRGAIAVDLELDGAIELAVQRWGYAPLLLRLADAEPWCTVAVEPSVVLAVDAGLASAAARPGPYRVEAMQGQFGMLGANRFVTPLRRGWVRFPSGAVAPFDCADGAVSRVREPRWLAVQAVTSGPATELCVDIGAGAWPEPIEVVNAAVRDADDARSALELVAIGERWCAPTLATVDRVMIQVNGRWIGVWIEPEAAG